MAATRRAQGVGGCVCCSGRSPCGTLKDAAALWQVVEREKMDNTTVLVTE